ncbi:autotransporter outer membrane beta-barrel domain-containing protein [Piscirickettsia salmonis]|uniref:ROmp B n=1 Tax=Piscirickettsia salmonis TaxID=1238 RepID=A0A9Q5VHD2_PISSA|nr:autotransporter domain-containing protein [Piscirickettsia salmonis]WGZ72703.1 autotransporter domain-containing protein [Piscirickettsia salmonis EM-90]ALA26163.1 outer membrane autotransporter barrel domain protein [Piscirickettsia salmonis]APS43605.1 autotransporter outer membrane beta-barrel domain-containing protein [Piscirickettsia salmonis]APS46960.1 autotransporter outer membrane beta-barrel domain-containing protein [Piscirickettsia salmonis]APS54805.1 autotransporter outer membran
MGNNVTRNGKANNTPTFQKSLLAASLTLALVGFGAPAAYAVTETISVTDANTPLSDDGNDNSAATDGTDGTDLTFATSEGTAGAVTFTGDIKGGQSTTGNAAAAGKGLDVITNKNLSGTITTTASKVINGGAAQAPAGAGAGNIGGIAIDLMPTAADAAKTTTTVLNLNSVATGGAGSNGDTSGVGGAGGVGVNINASANSATTVTSTVAITAGAGGDGVGNADTGGSGGAGIAIVDNTSDAQTAVNLNLGGNVTGGLAGEGAATNDGNGGAGITSALAAGALNLTVDSGKTVSGGNHGTGASGTSLAGAGIHITGGAATNTITNSGTIQAGAGGTAASYADAVSHAGTGALTITNNSGATISTLGTAATHEAINSVGTLTVTNSGTISSAGTTAIEKAAGSGAVAITNNSGATISGGTNAINIVAGGADADSAVTNAGTITGAIINADVDKKLSLSNSGTVTGAITGNGGGLVISDNSGTITGAVTTSANNGALTITQSAGGTIDGAVSADGSGVLTITNSGILGVGADTITGGSGATDALTMSGSAASAGTGAITAIETIKVSDGAIATFGGTIAGVTATGGIAVGVGATANFDAVISNSVTASTGNETIKYTGTAGAASLTLDGGAGTADVIILNASDLTNGNNATLTLKNFEQVQVSGAGTKLANDLVASGDPNGMDITDFTLNSGATGFDSNGKTIDAANVTLKGTLGSALILGTSAQTVVIDATAGALVLGQNLDGGATGVNTLTVQGGGNNVTTSALANFDSLAVASGSHTWTSAVTLKGVKTFNLNTGTTLVTGGGANTINAAISNLNGTLNGDLTYAASTTAAINIGAGFSTAAANTAIDGESTSDSDTLTITGTSSITENGRPQLGVINNIETITATGFSTLTGAVSNVTSFTNSGNLRLGEGAAAYTVAKLANTGTLDVSNTTVGNAPTITALTGSGGIQFNGGNAAALAPQLTATDAVTGGSSLALFADTTTNAANGGSNNEQAIFAAVGGYTQSSGNVTLETIPSVVDGGGPAQLTFTGGAVNLAGVNIVPQMAAQNNATGVAQQQFTDGETVAIIDASAASTFTPGTLVSSALLPVARKAGESGSIYTIVANGASKSIIEVSNVHHKGLASLLSDYASATATNLTTAQALSNATLSMNQTTLDQFEDQIDVDISASSAFAAASVASAFSGAGGSVISNRLASLQGNTALASASMSGIATGSATPKHGVWGQAFGNKLEQDAEDGVYGYDANSYGLAFGLDTQLGRNFTLGFALSYANSDVDTTGNRNQNTTVKSYQGSVYLGVDVDRFFINGNATYGFTQNDYSNVVTGFGTTNAEYNGNLFAFNAEAGYDIPLNHALTLTPMGAASYTYVNNEKYTETGYAAKTIDSDAIHMIKVGLGARIAYAVRQGDNTFTPSLQLMAYHTAANQPTSTFVFADTGGSPSASGVLAEGTDQDKNSIAATLGLSYEMANHMTVSAQTGYEWESSSKAYGGNLKIRYDF